MAEDEKSFKDRLVEELGYQGLSNKEFAQKLGISLGTLGMYLYRNSMPSADIAVKMATALNTTTEYLVTGEENGIKQNSKADWQKKEIMHILGELTPKQLACFLEIARSYKNALSE